jgi:type I restriction enzyme S subunit
MPNNYGALTYLVAKYGIPDGWEELQVGELAEIVGGSTPDREDLGFWSGGTIPWVTPTDLTEQGCKWIYETKDKITDRALNSCSTTLLPPGSVLYTSRATIGAKAIASVPIATNQGFANFKVNGRVSAECLYYFLDLLTPILKRLGAGTTFLEVSKRDIRKVKCAVPPRDEGDEIARILDAADAAIERTREAIAKARRVKVGLMQTLLTTGIDEEGNSRHHELRSARFVKTQFGNLPRSWEIVKVRDVADVGSGVTLGRDLQGCRTIELPYLRVANVQDGFLNLTEIKRVAVREDEVDRFSLQAGDVLMTEGGDFDKLGRGAIWEGQISPCLHQNHIFRVRADRQILNPHFLAAVIGSDLGKRYFMRIAKRTTNLATINKTQLRAFRFPLPPLDEQSRIVAVLGAMEKRLSTLERLLPKWEHLKRGLMQDLLTGRVRVNDQRF